MKKAFKYYFAAWLILLILFNALVFIVPSEISIGNMSINKQGRMMWFALAITDICFLANLFITWTALKQDKLSGTFYRLPMIKLSYACMIIVAIVGLIGVVIPFIPYWVTVIVELLLVAIYSLTIIKATAAAELVEVTEEKIRNRTSFVCTMTAEAESILAGAKSTDAREQSRKVFEALRYSDPVSSPELSELEFDIADKLSSLRKAVEADEIETVNAVSDQIIKLVSERNIKTKAGKR